MRSTVTFLCLVGFLGSVTKADPFPDPSLFGEPVRTPGLPDGSYMVSVNSAGDGMVFVMGAPQRLYAAEWLPSKGEWGNITQLSLGSGGMGWESAPSLSQSGGQPWLFYNASNGTDKSYLYRSAWDGSGWSPGVPVPGLDQTGRESESFFDGDHLYFTRFATLPSYTQSDIFRALYDAETDSFGEAEALGSLINDGSLNRTPYVSPDGDALLFSSDRDGSIRTWLSLWDEDAQDWGVPLVPAWPVDVPGVNCGCSYAPGTGTLYFNIGGIVHQSTIVPEPGTCCILLLAASMVLVRRPSRSCVRP